MGMLLSALFTEPGRPADQRALSHQRQRSWRAVAACQVCAAVSLIGITVYSGPLSESSWSTLLALSVPISLLGLGRPLIAWRVALLGSVLAPLAVWRWDSDAFALLLAPASAVYLYRVAVAYDRRVLQGAWLATTVLAPVSVTIFVEIAHRTEIFGSRLVDEFGQDVAVTAFLLPTIPAALGYIIRSRRLAWTALIDEQRRTAQEHTSRALLEERARIARELHDVVAHHMSVIAIHAETAPYKMPDPPLALTESFAVIRASALEALTELRRLLALLRSDGVEAATTPQPTLTRIDDLIDAARSSGLDIRLRVDGVRPVISPGLDLSAFRIVQEGLSNALRHASGSTVWVGIEYTPSAVHVAVYNDRPGGPQAMPDGVPAGAGHGLLGMRERVTMLHGTLFAQPTPDGGFLVKADLPLEPAVIVSIGGDPISL